MIRGKGVTRMLGIILKASILKKYVNEKVIKNFTFMYQHLQNKHNIGKEILTQQNMQQ